MQTFGFHPAIAGWFERSFGSPTEPQERGWPAIQSGAHTLIAAPTGSGKTLAAFFAELDGLFRAGLAGELKNETRVVYVSPLKALSNDIHKNLEQPLAGIAAALAASEGRQIEVRAALRTGDTPASQRQALNRKPPHILVTTPESLYLLLTSKSGRGLLRTARTLIVDEIHAVVGNRRGSHLALSMERLGALVGGRLQRIGLSATQRPIEEVARFLVGGGSKPNGIAGGCSLSIPPTTARGPLTPALSPSEGEREKPASVPSQPVAVMQPSDPRLPLRGREDRDEGASFHDRPCCQDAPVIGCTIIDAGYKRELDVAIELPGSALEAVMSNEVWGEVYLRLAELIEAHRTTLVFVNTRRLAERVAHQLGQRLGQDKVSSHHGSLSAKLRLEAEGRLKRGELKVLVATASLELGIDIGAVDLVCQLGPTRSIATLLQRVGRAQHRRGGLPKGRIFPLSRDELVECVATLRSLRSGQLDQLEIPPKPMDVLAQQIVACAATEDWNESRLFDLVSSAYPYRDLTREEFDEVLRMLAEGFSTKRGRRSALLHLDAVNHRVRARRGAGLVALTSGGAIPDNADYRVVLEPGETFIGTVNEDFAIESMAGEIFQLGNTSWKILGINAGQVRVADAQGQPPTMPFWLGEAPGRTREVSRAVSELREEVRRVLEASTSGPLTPALSPSDGEREKPTEALNHERPTDVFMRPDIPPLPLRGEEGRSEGAALDSSQVRFLVEELLKNQPGLPTAGARQLADYFAASYKALGVIPSQNRIVLERFFDESGGMQLVIHSPFGIRMNRAWGLALRKRFCRSFNFELQAAATDDAIVLSLGTQHSFPLDEVFYYLNSQTVRDLLIQALLDAPMFPIRWRWNATRALALPRQRGGRKIPAPLQRMESENLLAAVFPDQLACLENITGDREVPDHPLVNQTIEDCLSEAMDIFGLISLLKKIESGEVQCVARDLPEPSPMAHEILNARPYAFLDDAPLEERRTRAVYTRRANEASLEEGLGNLDAAAIEKVSAEAKSTPTNADELHEALIIAGVLKSEEVLAHEPWLDSLVKEKRAGQLTGSGFWLAAERLPVVQAVYPQFCVEPQITAPAFEGGTIWDHGEALRELLRGRMEISGPVTLTQMADFLQLPRREIEAAMLALEAEGFVLRGKFRPGAPELEWCERRLLARIHRLTINRLRSEIQPVSIAEFLRFLTAWQRVDAQHKAEGPDGLSAVIEQMDGYELPAGAWEPDVLALRVKDYNPQWLDQFCLTGRAGWTRLIPSQSGNGRPLAPIRSSPVAIYLRPNLPAWLALSVADGKSGLTPDVECVLETLRANGALFFGELVQRTGLLPSRVEQALSQLSAQGGVTSDSFEGLRALLLPPEKRAPFADKQRKRRHKAVSSLELAGRWSLVRNGTLPTAQPTTPDRREAGLEVFAQALLRRYGIVFRRLLERESLKVSWFELGRVYRRLEARGEIRGGYFVGGVSGEQFALPEAIGLLRSLRKLPAPGELIAVSGADPLNLTGLLAEGPRVAAITSNRVLLRDGVPIAALEAGRIQTLESSPPEPKELIERRLRTGSLPVALRPYYG